MGVFNLDKFKTVTSVSIDGTVYHVFTLTVGQFIEADFQAIEAMTDLKEQAKTMVELLGRMTDIPEDVLMKRSFPELMALISIAQGNVPEEPGDEDGGGQEDEEPGKK